MRNSAHGFVSFWRFASRGDVLATEVKSSGILGNYLELSFEGDLDIFMAVYFVIWNRGARCGGVEPGSKDRQIIRANRKWPTFFSL